MNGQFNMDDRIRTEGRAKLEAFSPSPELGSRIAAHTRARIRRRRRRSIAAMGAAMAALVVAGIVVLRPQPQRSISPAADSATAAPVTAAPVTDDGVPSPPSVPTNTEIVATDPSGPALNSAAQPRSFVTVDYSTYAATERSLSGSVLRNFTVGYPATDFQTMPNGWVIALGDSGPLPTNNQLRDTPPCTNVALRADHGDGQFTDLHPDLSAARHIAIANGQLFAVRDVCPAGAGWGDPGTGWALEVIDLNPLDVSPPVRILFESAVAAPGVASSTVTNLVVSPDGFRAAIELSGENYGWSLYSLEDQWRVRSIENPAVRLDLGDCRIAGRPAFLESQLIVVPCSYVDGTFGAAMTFADGIIMWERKVEGSVAAQATVSVFVDEANPENPYVLVSGIGTDPNVLTTVAMIHDRTATVLATDTVGVAAWTLTDLGLEETGPTIISPDTVAPAPIPSDALVVRYDSELPGAPPEVVADLGIAERAANDLNTIAEFSSFGTGTAVVFDPVTGMVTRAGRDGTIWRNRVPLEDQAGAVWDIELGPGNTSPGDTSPGDTSPDDTSPGSTSPGNTSPGDTSPLPILYVSRVTSSAGNGEVFTLVAYELPSDRELVNEVGRWQTTWPCQETLCGDIVFTDQGIDLGNGEFAMIVAPQSVISDPVHDVGNYEPLPNLDCLDDAGYNLTAMTERISYSGHSWVLAAACVQVQEGSYTRFSPQPDGSVLATLVIKRLSSENGRYVLAHFRADGSSAAYDIPVTYRDVAFVDGRILAIEAVPNGNYRVVELVPPS